MKRENLVANVDGMIFDTLREEWGVLEIKTANEFAKKEWVGDEIPNSYFAQVQHYLYVTGAKFAWIACLIGGNTYKEFKIERSGEDCEYIAKVCNDFWENNILKEIPPIPDGSDSYSKFLLKQSDTENTDVEEMDSLDCLGKEYKELKSKIDELEKQKRIVEQEIISKMNDNDCKKAKSDSCKYTIVTQNRVSVDKKRMEQENTELVEQYKTVEKLYSTEKETKFLKVS